VALDGIRALEKGRMVTTSVACEERADRWRRGRLRV
jgi:hypothetical protein